MNKDLKIHLRISPNASKNEVVRTDERIKIKLTAQPVDGKANKALTEFLSKEFRIPKTNIEILKGHTSKEKTLLLKNLDDEKYKKLSEIFTAE